MLKTIELEKLTRQQQGAGEQPATIKPPTNKMNLAEMSGPVDNHKKEGGELGDKNADLKSALYSSFYNALYSDFYNAL